MGKSPQKNTYKQLVQDITALYDHARRTLVESYWQIGKPSYTSIKNCLIRDWRSLCIKGPTRNN